MKKFYDSFSFVLAFLIGIVISQSFLGSKITNLFLLLVLLSMLVVNANKFTTFLNKI